MVDGLGRPIEGREAVFAADLISKFKLSKTSVVGNTREAQKQTEIEIIRLWEGRSTCPVHAL